MMQVKHVLLMPALKVYFVLLSVDIYFGVVGLNKISNIVHFRIMLYGLVQ